MFRLNRYSALTLITASALLAGCASQPVVSYGDSKAVETVTNEFGSTDLQTIAETMARSLASSPVVRNRPYVTIAEVRNKTSEYIDTRSITQSIRTQLLKAGAVRFTVDTMDMGNQSEELMRQNQSGLYDKSKSKKIGKMQGADYRLEGEITSIVKRTSDVKDVFYKFTLTLVDNESGTIEWADEKEIRKTSRR